MILARASRYCIAAAFACAATVAQADVMELDANGARWVAGGSGAASIGPAADTSAARSEMRAPTTSDVVITSPSRYTPGVPLRYAATIQALSERYQLSPALLEALVWQESRWRENAISPAGARGLAQLMPDTARYLGVDPDDPYANLEGGARYLREQLNRFGGNLELALAAYNAGPERVARAGGIPNIRETRHYVASIMARLSAHAVVAGQ